MSRTCAICRSVNRKSIDAMLASDSHCSPSRIARTFVGFSKPQIKRHRDRCLAGIPATLFALRAGSMTEEDLRERLEATGRPPSEVENMLTVVGRLLGESA